MRTLKCSVFASILFVAGCGAPRTGEPTQTTTVRSEDPDHLVADPAGLPRSRNVAVEWARRWWTTPDAADRPAAVWALSTPEFLATLTMAHPTAGVVGRCTAVRDVRAFIGHGSGAEVTVTGSCQTRLHIETRVIMLVITDIGGQVLVAGAR